MKPPRSLKALNKKLVDALEEAEWVAHGQAGRVARLPYRRSPCRCEGDGMRIYYVYNEAGMRVREIAVSPGSVTMLNEGETMERAPLADVLRYDLETIRDHDEFSPEAIHNALSAIIEEVDAMNKAN